MHFFSPSLNIIIDILLIFLWEILQALQAPACHENMVKVGSYVLGEFGNLIAGDQRSSPAVQFQLLHSKV
jgi:hypothetical protein